MRNYLTGALLYYEHYSQRGKDSICEGELFQGTSKAAEDHAVSAVLTRARQEGMNIAVHWQDDDLSASDSFKHLS